MIAPRFRLSTLLLFVTVFCTALALAVAAGNRVLRQRRLLDYLGAKYGNRPWAGVRYNCEAEIGELHYRSVLTDLSDGIVEVEIFQGFESFDETALMVSHVPSIQIIRVDESDLSDAGIHSLCKLKKHRTLEIPWSSVGDIGLMELASLRSLKRLDIRFSDRDLTIEAVERFRRQRPDVELLVDATLSENEATHS